MLAGHRAADLAPRHIRSPCTCTPTWQISSWWIRWKLSWQTLRGLEVAWGPRMTMRFESSGQGYEDRCETTRPQCLSPALPPRQHHRRDGPWARVPLGPGRQQRRRGKQSAPVRSEQPCRAALSSRMLVKERVQPSSTKAPSRSSMGNLRRRKLRELPPGAWGTGAGAVSRVQAGRGASPGPGPPAPAHRVTLGHGQDEAVEVAGAPVDEVEAIHGLQLSPHKRLPAGTGGTSRLPGAVPG